MITPRFRLEQNDHFVIAYIETPYVKFSEVEISIHEQQFSFYCKPYHLQLYFSNSIIEDGRESAQFDVDKGQFTVKIPKQVKRVVFSDLDMLTKLMTPVTSSEKIKASSLIEVLDSSKDVAECEEDNIDWTIEQTIPEDELPVLASTSPHYGFNGCAHGVFTLRQEDLHELLDLSNPDTTPVAERGRLQRKTEQKAFSADHYLADYCDDDAIAEFIAYEPEWRHLRKQKLSGGYPHPESKT